MGGGYYDGDVGERTRSSGNEHFVQTAMMQSRPIEERGCHPSLNPKNKKRESCASEEHPDPTSIVVAMDLTRSRGDDARVIFGKLPMMFGQIMLHRYVDHPQICFAGVGDATEDRAPLQVGQFESDNRLDDVLANMWIEGGGGGTGQESYELAAYYFARKTMLDCLKKGKKGILFFLGDEGFYPAVDKKQIEKVIGDRLPEDIPTEEIFEELKKSYDVYLIFPRMSWEKRKADIDEEIRQRVTKAGGMIDGVDLRFSLIWNNRNDLDLHVQTPSGEHIYYGSKRARCGGELDVDQNVHGENPKPVENTRWAKGTAKRGTYKVWVENYNFHEQSSAATEFKVEIEINGELTTFEGKTPARATQAQSRTEVGEFFYEPPNRQNEKLARYEGYDDSKIKAQWAKVISSENVLMVEDPKGVVDVMLGVLAVASKSRTLDEYLRDMKERGQSDDRIADVKHAIGDLAERVSTAEVDIGSIPQPKKRRKAAAVSAQE